MKYKCGNCGNECTPILHYVGVAADCCEEAVVLVEDDEPRYRALTPTEEDELKRELFDDLPRASRKAIARGENS